MEKGHSSKDEQKAQSEGWEVAKKIFLLQNIFQIGMNVTKGESRRQKQEQAESALVGDKGWRVMGSRGTDIEQRGQVAL